MTPDKFQLARCFIALEVSRDCINDIEEIQKLVKKKNFFYGKFTEPENLHLTLKFVGEIEPTKVEEIKKKLSEIKFSSFEASLGELGIFDSKFPRILWIKLNGKEIWDLQEKIDIKMKELGFKPEERFMSHITIARIKKVINRTEFFNYIKALKHKSVKLKIKDFVFKKSELKEEGPVYTDLLRVAL